MLIDRARKLRETPPAGHCPTCYARWCRLLYIDHCICTGHITTRTPRPFSPDK